jgi:hypothetical protein
MVATVEISESNGVTPTVTDGVTHLNMGSTDMTALVVATYPITCGTNSYHKAVRIHVANMGGSNTINNFQFWKDSGTYKTEETMVWLTQASYIQPVATSLGSTAIPTADPGSSNVAGSLAAAGYSDYIMFQIKTTTNTEAGNANQKVLKFQYDEA